MKILKNHVKNVGRKQYINMIMDYQSVGIVMIVLMIWLQNVDQEVGSMNLQDVIKEARKDLTRQNPPKTIEVPVWVRGSFKNVRRECFPSCHRHSYYSHIKDELGLIPEEYGYYYYFYDYHDRKHTRIFTIEANISEEHRGKTFDVEDDHYIIVTNSGDLQFWEIEEEKDKVIKQ